MTTDEIKLAIAETTGEADKYVIVKNGFYYLENACGYTDSIDHAWKLPKGEAKKHEMYADSEIIPYTHKVFIKQAPLPDYTGDLNAIHKAEKVLTDDQRVVFRINLSNNSGKRNTEFATVEAAMCHATASQRAEAFLRTVGKWKR